MLEQYSLVAVNLKSTKDFLISFKANEISYENLSLPNVSSSVAAMKMPVYFVPVFFLFLVQVIVNKFTIGETTSDPLLNFDDSSSEGKKECIFQDRLVERLNSLVALVDQSISMILSEKRNPPNIKLLKGICPEMLMQEPQNGLRFRCHAFGSNECYCFSHKKASWYRAEAFCRRFGMTLADLSPEKVRKMIKEKVNDSSAVDDKGEWYWTSATDRFIRGQLIWMNTGRTHTTNCTASEFERCLKFSGSHEKEFSSHSCIEENHFFCQKFLNFFPHILG